MATINQIFKNGQEYTFSISQVPEISTDTAVIYSVQDTSNNLTARKINNTVFGLTYNGNDDTFTSNIKLVINGVSGYDIGLTINFTVNGTLSKAPVRIYNLTNYQISVDIYRSSSSAPTLDIYYCVGSTEGTYTHYTNSTDYGSNPVKSIAVGANKSVWIYSDTMTTWATNTSDYIHIKTPAYSNVNQIQLSGNIMSLITGNLQNYCFYKLFESFATLGTVSSDFLPATTLAMYCYQSMFNTCSRLTNTPNLPATKMENSCYSQMFQYCSKITNAPVLPATTLADSCYSQMFKQCTSLIQPPALPATTLPNYCYQNMFEGCRSLTTAPTLPATTLGGTNPYQKMFLNCTQLNYIKALFTTTPGYSKTDNWVSGVAATGTFVKNHNATWELTDANGIPSGWTVITDTEENDDGGME